MYSALNVDAYVPVAPENVTNVPTVSPVVDAISVSQVQYSQLNTIDDSTDIEGRVFPTRLEKKTMDLGNPDAIKIIKKVTPRITGTAGTIVYIRIGTQMLSDDDVSWGTEQQYTIGTDREVYFTQKGRFISIRMRTQNIGDSWKCHGFYIDAAETGRY